MEQNFPWSDFEPSREDARSEYTSALRDMERRRYTQAAHRLEWILGQNIDHRHGLADVRELLVRCYFHSARLKKAEGLARGILSDRPSDGWAALVLARSLERQGRLDEARAPAALASALGHQA